MLKPFLTAALLVAAGVGPARASMRPPKGVWPGSGPFSPSWSPDLNDGLATPVRSYHVLAKQTPADSVWTDVTDTPSLPATLWRFFRVSVSLPE